MAENQRWKWQVPANLSLLFLSHLPLKLTYDEFERMTGKYVSNETLSKHCFFSMTNLKSYRIHTLLLYPFCNFNKYDEMIYFSFFTLHIVPMTGNIIICIQKQIIISRNF